MAVAGTAVGGTTVGGTAGTAVGVVQAESTSITNSMSEILDFIS
jgi:hypothetical protein